MILITVNRSILLISQLNDCYENLNVYLNVSKPEVTDSIGETIDANNCSKSYAVESKNKKRTYQ